MQALLEDLAVSDQPMPVPDRPPQRLDGVGAGGSAGALTDEPDQRRTIAIVGLGATPPPAGFGPPGSLTARTTAPTPASVVLAQPPRHGGAGRSPPPRSAAARGPHWPRSTRPGRPRPRAAPAMTPAPRSGHAPRWSTTPGWTPCLAQQLHHQPPPHQPQATSLPGQVPHKQGGSRAISRTPARLRAALPLAASWAGLQALSNEVAYACMPQVRHRGP